MYHKQLIEYIFTPQFHIFHTLYKIQSNMATLGGESLGWHTVGKAAS
jgi:hypothetical protein